MKRRVCSNAPAHRPTASCDFLIDRGALTATCHRCGRTLPFDPIPVQPRAPRR